MRMHAAGDLVSDDLWDVIAPLLPAEPAQGRGGSLSVPRGAALGGIVYVL
jgi:transposase